MRAKRLGPLFAGARVRKAKKGDGMLAEVAAYRPQKGPSCTVCALPRRILDEVNLSLRELYGRHQGLYPALSKSLETRGHHIKQGVFGHHYREGHAAPGYRRVA